MIISKQLKYFLIIGLVTVLIDYSTYRSLIFFESNISIAKSIGFALGTIFSFIANRNITFNVKNNFFGHLIKFSLLYFTSMMFNVFVNSISLRLFTNSNLKVQISFILATIISATINFGGMKYFVFKYFNIYDLKKINFLFYRYRFLFLYIIFGFFSLVIELIISKFLLFYNIPFLPTTIFAFLIGLLSAFFLNVRFNFHITQAKRKKALFYFSLISTLSFSIQTLLRSSIQSYGYDIDASRFMIAGSFFMVSYLLHRNLSFREYKKVGVAIYADGVEDIKLIFNKISNISDFIHIDIVDKTYNPNCKDVKAYRAEVVRAYWQNKKIEVHIMSRNPSVWLDDLLPYVDVIYIHPTMDENLGEVIDKINFSNVEAGIALSVYESLEIIDSYIENNKIKHVLLLTIPQPGFSGQKFDVSALPILERLNAHKNRSEFEICIDGGVNDSTVKYLNVESVVSGSYILGAPNPIKNIMHLQTSGEYAQY